MLNVQVPAFASRLAPCLLRRGSPRAFGAVVLQLRQRRRKFYTFYIQNWQFYILSLDFALLP